MVNKKRFLFAASLANVFEWYDYALFGNLVEVIGSKFFTDSGASDKSLLWAFFAFAVGYLMRPLGGVVFGVIGDRVGRKSALALSVICMSFPTVTMGILPTYSAIGVYATVVMVLARMIQGLSMGGALIGSVTFNIEHTEKRYHGLVGSLSMVGICVGILLGSLTVAGIKSVLTAGQFESWGWRVPFLLGFLIFIVGFYIKKYVDETPVFEEAKDKGFVLHSPLLETLRHHWFDMLMSVFINSTGSVVFYMGAVFVIPFLKLRGLDEMSLSYLVSFCYFCMSFVTLGVGWLSDFVGRRRLFVINLLCLIVVVPFVVSSLETGSLRIVVIAQLLLSFFAAAYIGPEPALQAEFYPANIRSTALSLSYNVATSVFGGATPYIMMLVLEKTGKLSYCIWYIELCAALSLLGLFFYKDHSRELR